MALTNEEIVSVTLSFYFGLEADPHNGSWLELSVPIAEKQGLRPIRIDFLKKSLCSGIDSLGWSGDDRDVGREYPTLRNGVVETKVEERIIETSYTETAYRFFSKSDEKHYLRRVDIQFYGNRRPYVHTQYQPIVDQLEALFGGILFRTVHVQLRANVNIIARKECCSLYVSPLLRGSSSSNIDVRYFNEISGKLLVVDSFNMAFLDTQNFSTASRLSFLLALAYSYLKTVEAFQTEVYTTNLADNECLQKVRDQCTALARFDVNYFFSNPVSPDTNFLWHSWEPIASRLHLRAAYSDIERQLKNARHQVNEVVAERARIRSKLLQRAMTTLSFVVGLLTVVQIVIEVFDYLRLKSVDPANAILLDIPKLLFV